VSIKPNSRVVTKFLRSVEGVYLRKEENRRYLSQGRGKNKHGLRLLIDVVFALVSVGTVPKSKTIR
jgi:hypothetical protein